MKISVNKIRSVNQMYDTAGDPAPEGIDHLVRKIGDQLGAVEEVIPFGDRFAGVLVAKIISCEDHPNADRLHICKVDDGSMAQNVERDENGFVQVVCGAPNVREGLAVAWLPPGATVPSTYYDVDPFVLDARALRGVLSNGMLASPKELSIGDNHDGIMELDDNIAPGTPFGQAYKLEGEAVIDIENKMFTHRPDCFGMLGVAREIAGIYGQPYRSPQWYTLNPEVPAVEADELKLEVRNEIPQLVPRFTAITMRDITLKSSPVWLQVYLASLGLRPINNIVDYTNFFMLETGQPLHAYDYDKVQALSSGDHATIVVRHPHEGEKITLLSSKEIQPRAEAIMIATDRQLIGVGGVMGGGDTEVDEHTKNIILECATFDMYSIRRTSMAHGLFTDAVTRFNKGQSPLQNKAVLMKIVDEIRTHADGKVAGQLIDDNHLPTEVNERGSLCAPVTLTAQFINERLGLDLSSEDITTLLTNVEFAVDGSGDSLSVTAPFWRTDIAIPEDVVEEVGRLYGYDHLPLLLPQRDLTPAKRDQLLDVKQKIRSILARSGANEVLGYSFVHGNLLDRVGQDRALAYQISNAISPDLQYFRLSLTPSLLEKIHPNIKTGYDQFALFEIGKTHVKGHMTDSDDQAERELPFEHERAAFVVAADAKAAKNLQGAAYYQAKKYLETLLNDLNLTDVRYEPLAADDTDTASTYYQPGRAATVFVDGKIIGRIGEYKASVRKGLKLPEYCAGFELGLTPLLGLLTDESRYKPLPKFPSISQDICLRVPADLSYGELYAFVASHLAAKRPDQTSHTLAPVDIYQREGDTDHKQITLRLQIASFERTLTDDEVSLILESVAQAAHEQYAAERV
jgi:phenylalanyl-tRNA synthetase beta chain